MSQSYFVLGFMIESANLELPFPPPTHIWCMLTHAAFMIESAHSEWPFPTPTPNDWSDEDAYLKHESRDLWKEDFNVTVVLNPWHRPRLLANQLKALHEQVYMHKQRVHKKIHEWLCERDSVYAHALLSHVQHLTKILVGFILGYPWWRFIQTRNLVNCLSFSETNK